MFYGWAGYGGARKSSFLTHDSDMVQRRASRSRSLYFIAFAYRLAGLLQDELVIPFGCLRLGRIQKGMRHSPYLTRDSEMVKRRVSRSRSRSLSLAGLSVSLVCIAAPVRGNEEKPLAPRLLLGNVKKWLSKPRSFTTVHTGGYLTSGNCCSARPGEI